MPSTNIVKNGHNSCDSTLYKCKDCKAHGVLISKRSTEKIDKEALERTYLERNSYRSTGRIFKISHVSVMNMIKKKVENLAPFKTTIAAATEDDVLEVDEIFTYISRKINQIRIWIVQSRKTRQIVSFFIGDGSMESCKRLWRKLPTEYLYRFSFSDFWRAYNCLPTLTHQKVGKETGETAHIERLNNTLRQRIGRMVRKTLSFSKKEYRLNIHFKLFAFYYNLDCIT